MLRDRSFPLKGVIAGVVAVVSAAVLASAACSHSELPGPAPSSTPPASSSLLTIRPSGTGTGTVTANPPGPYRVGDTVVLTATPGPTSLFSGWTAPCPTTQPPPATCTVTIPANGLTISAQFDLD